MDPSSGPTTSARLAALLLDRVCVLVCWRGRDFYLGSAKLRDQLFDRNGNAGSTVWVDGRVVGRWVRDDAGVVEVRLLERVSARARRSLDAEASRLTEWLGGVRIRTVLPSPSMKSGPPIRPGNMPSSAVLLQAVSPCAWGLGRW